MNTNKAHSSFIQKAIEDGWNEVDLAFINDNKIMTDLKLLDYILKSLFKDFSKTTVKQIIALGYLFEFVFNKNKEKSRYNGKDYINYKVTIKEKSIKVKLQSRLIILNIEEHSEDYDISFFFDIDKLDESFSFYMNMGCSLDDLYNNLLDGLKFDIKHQFDLDEVNIESLKLLEMVNI